MDDLIYRQVAVDALSTPHGIMYPIRAIESLPSVDAVQVVRCRDCKHFAGEGMYCAQNIIVQFDHFYCYYAEKKIEQLPSAQPEIIR